MGSARRWRKAALLIAVGGALLASSPHAEPPPQTKPGPKPDQPVQDSRPSKNLEKRVEELEKLVQEELEEEARTICAKRWPYFENAQKTCERYEYDLLLKNYQETRK